VADGADRDRSSWSGGRDSNRLSVGNRWIGSRRAPQCLPSLPFHSENRPRCPGSADNPLSDDSWLPRRTLTNHAPSARKACRRQAANKGSQTVEGQEFRWLIDRHRDSDRYVIDHHSGATVIDHHSGATVLDHHLDDGTDYNLDRNHNRDD
jgi:hypothetical protein